MAKKQKQQKPKHIQAFFFFGIFLLGLYIVSVANGMNGVTGAVTAEEIFTNDLLSTYKDTYNEKANGLPDILFTFFGDDVVNIYLTDLDHHLYAVLADNELVELENGQQEDPSFEITTTYDTLVLLQQGDLGVSDAVDQGLISFSSDSFVKEAEISTVLYSIDIYSLFDEAETE